MDEIEDLYDEETIFEEMKQEGNIILDQSLGGDPQGALHREGPRKPKTKSQKELSKIEDANFVKEYMKAGGIQHIICSATLTIDKQGRVTPRSAKADKKKKAKAKIAPNKGQKGYKKPEEETNTIEELCKVLKFRSKNPKIIDLTD